MDASALRAITDALVPIFAFLTLTALPVGLIFVTKHFKLKTRELELEAELHGRDAQARIAAMETRMLALEGALGSLVQALSQRPELPEATLPARPLSQVK